MELTMAGRRRTSRAGRLQRIHEASAASAEEGRDNFTVLKALSKDLSITFFRGVIFYCESFFR